MRAKAFTLVEMATVVMIIGLLAGAIASLIMAAQRSWTKQTKEIAVLRDLGWAMEYMVADIRTANNGTMSVDADNNGISFTSPYGDIWYWYEPGVSSNTVYHDVIYRAQGTSSNNSTLVRFIAAPNPGSAPIFNYDSANSLVTICLTAQPRVSGNASFVGGNFTLRTKVRLRNQ